MAGFEGYNGRCPERIKGGNEVFLAGGGRRFDGGDATTHAQACHNDSRIIPDYPVMFENLFSDRGLSIDRLRVLVEVHDAGGIAQAAPGDPVRQSQYSRQLRELSEFFGVEVARRA